MKFLFLEDEADAVVLMARLLKKAGFVFDVVHVETEAEFRQEMPTSDILFVDCAMPNFSCEEALLVWHDAEEKQPFIIVSGTISNIKGTILKGIGATDVVLKGEPDKLAGITKDALEKFGKD